MFTITTENKFSLFLNMLKYTFLYKANYGHKHPQGPSFLLAETNSLISLDSKIHLPIFKGLEHDSALHFRHRLD
jgi:hypothetical protein